MSAISGKRTTRVDVKQSQIAAVDVAVGGRRSSPPPEIHLKRRRRLLSLREAAG
jgi:hypothetical protein